MSGVTVTTTYYGSYVVVTFTATTNTTTGTTTWTPPAGVTQVDYLVVGGGGGAGSSDNNGTAGGGGGGGVLQGFGFSVSGTISVQVGGGGTLGSSGRHGNNGGNSIFSTITAYGGGGGGEAESGDLAQNGGCGGGAGGITNYTSPGSGVAGQGYAGGDGAAGSYPQGAGGGGGGAGAVGGNASGTGTAGSGGIGVQSSIATGTPIYYGGGGGGGCHGGTGGTGGNGGGGAGSNTWNLSNAVSGTPGLGGGSGANAGVDTGAQTGGSGVVIIRYLVPGWIAVAAPVGVGATGVLSTFGSALSAHAPVSVVASGVLLNKIKIAGQAPVGVKATVILSDNAGMKGQAPVAVKAGGALANKTPMGGHAPVAVHAGAALANSALLYGQAPVSVAAVALVLEAGSMVGLAPVGVAATGQLSADIPIGVQAPVGVKASGVLIEAGSMVGLAPVSVQATGVLTNGLPLAGHAPVNVATTGVLTIKYGLLGTAPVAVKATGVLGDNAILIGQAPVGVQATGVLWEKEALYGQALVGVAALGVLNGPIAFYGSAPIRVVARASLTCVTQILPPSSITYEPGLYRVTDITVERTVQDAYYKCTINTSGYSDYPAWSRVVPWMPNYDGTLPTVFLGMLPYATHSMKTANNVTTLLAYSYDYYLAKNPVPRYLWTTNGISDPGAIITALVNSTGVSGFPPISCASCMSTPGWGTTIPYKQFSWTEKTTIQDAINEIQAYTQMIFICSWHAVGGVLEPVWFWIPADAIDTYFTDLPPVATITLGSGEGAHVDSDAGADVTDKPDDGYNTVIARGTDSLGNLYECMIDSTGLIWLNNGSASTLLPAQTWLDSVEIALGTPNTNNPAQIVVTLSGSPMTTGGTLIIGGSIYGQPYSETLAVGASDPVGTVYKTCAKMICNYLIPNCASSGGGKLAVTTQPDLASTGQYVTSPPGAPFNQDFPCTYTDPTNSAFGSFALVQARAQLLYQYVTVVPFVYRVELIGRVDLQIYQRIQFTNFQIINSQGVPETAIPYLGTSYFRIIGITKKMTVTDSGIDVRSQIQFTADTYLSQKNLLIPVMADDAVTELNNLVDYKQNKVKKTKTATITSVSSKNQITVTTPDGSTVTAQVPQ